jgi:excisionase family DNA binding protein
VETKPQNTSPLPSDPLVQVGLVRQFAATSPVLQRTSTVSALENYSCRVADDELLTVKQIARELGLANTKVMSLIRRGCITAVSRPAGPATWRVSREAFDAYLDERRTASTRVRVRQHERQLKDLIDAWENLSDSELQRLEAQLPTDMFGPLKRLTGPACTSPEAEIEAISRAYRRRTEAGIEELALDMPHDLFWAVARIS